MVYMIAEVAVKSVIHISQGNDGSFSPGPGSSMFSKHAINFYW